jgi:hypothetical protein
MSALRSRGVFIENFWKRPRHRQQRMKSNRLQLNAGKTEVLWCATGRRQTASISYQPLQCRSMSRQQPQFHLFRDPGIFIDAEL